MIIYEGPTINSKLSPYADSNDIIGLDEVPIILFNMFTYDETRSDEVSDWYYNAAPLDYESKKYLLIRLKTYVYTYDENGEQILTSEYH